ncbi:hypothetical protein [Microbispora bryophytorum]|uniref:hypothetical protein n=1 Tax=Microbispora bryophytorum TaxID=1460882 RepID=UPI0033EF0489
MIDMRKNARESYDPNRGLWLAVIVLGGVIVGAITCVVFRALDVDLAAALGAGGAAFVGSTTLGISARKYLIE